MFTQINFPIGKLYKQNPLIKFMNFIKKIFEKRSDGLIHLQFQKFSKGEFKNRAVISAKKTSNKYTISTSAEFTNELVREFAERLGDNKTNITGAIISTGDLKGELEFKEIKQFQGVKRYLIDTEMSGSQILSLLNKLPKAFFALSFEFGETKLKIKPKAPKSGKPGKGEGEKPKPDFCKIITKDKKLAEDFVFEVPDFKKAEITHSFFIDELVKPEGEEDYARIRELSKRKGKIVRESEIDGEKFIKETGFEA